MSQSPACERLRVQHVADTDVGYDSFHGSVPFICLYSSLLSGKQAGIAVQASQVQFTVQARRLRHKGTDTSHLCEHSSIPTEMVPARNTPLKMEPGRGYGNHPFLSLPTTSEPLWPPKPKLFDMQTERVRCRA